MTTTGRPVRALGAASGSSISKGWMPLVRVIEMLLEQVDRQPSM